MRGLFITFEGGEGVGKSTQMDLALDRLRAVSDDVVALREPGGTPVGDRVRALLLEPGDGMDPVTELLLSEASRAELVRRVIAPALERGAAVVCDRFTDSTVAYQGHGRGIGADEVRALNDAATDGIVPDVTVLLTTDMALGLARATHGGADRIESEPSAFHARVAAGFAAIAGEEPDRVLVVDASGTVEEVAGRVWAALAAHPAAASWLAAKRP